MTYSVILSIKARKQLRSLDKSIRLMILKWMKKHLDGCNDPFVYGHALTEDKSGFWRYRVGDYRLIAKIDKGNLVIIMVEIGHRSKIYD